MLLDDAVPVGVAPVANTKSSKWMNGTARTTGFFRCQASMPERSSMTCASLSSMGARFQARSSSPLCATSRPSARGP